MHCASAGSDTPNDQNTRAKAVVVQNFRSSPQLAGGRAPSKPEPNSGSQAVASDFLAWTTLRAQKPPFALEGTPLY